MSSVLEIRSWFEVPAIAHYCYLFRAAFDLTEFEIEDLEDSLLIDGAAEGEETSFLPDLLARLLRGLYRTKEINGKNYGKYLNDLLDYHYTYLNGKKNPVKETDFRKLPCRTKVTILYDICHWRLEVDDIQELLKGKEAEELRIEPIGYNSKGDTFWYFYGTRLYKESLIDKEPFVANGDHTMFSRKRGKGKYRNRKKRDHRWIDSSSDYETGSDWDSQDSQVTHEDTSTTTGSSSLAGGTKWSLECSTVEEWNVLADSLKNSRDANEKGLLSILVNQFLDRIAEMIEAKEKALHKKLLLDSMPRRASGRIALKLLQKEEEERVEEEERLLREQEKMRETEERRKEMEEKKKNEREKRLKERERMAEERRLEREQRLKHREEQKWALENPELASQIGMTLRNGEADGEKKHDENRDSSSSIGRDEDEYTAMYKVIAAVKKHKDAWPFLEPVEESYAPQYYEIIKYPMDISTIEKKLDISSYENRDEMTADFKLIVSNCHHYNGPDSPYTKMSNNLERAYNKHFAKEFPEEINVSDEDYDVDEDDSFKKRKRMRPGRTSDRGGVKKSKFTDGNVGPDDPAGIDKQHQLHGTEPNPVAATHLPQMPAFPPQNILRFGNAAYPTGILRASMLQSQLRGTGIFQLLSAANGTATNAPRQPPIHPRLPFTNRPELRIAAPVTSSPFMNLMSRGPTATTGSAVQMPTAPSVKQNAINAVLNQQAIIRGLLATGNAAAAQQAAQFTPEQLQVLHRISIMKQQEIQQRLQQQQQQQQQNARQHLQQQQQSNKLQQQEQQQQQQQSAPQKQEQQHQGSSKEKEQQQQQHQQQQQLQPGSSQQQQQKQQQQLYIEQHAQQLLQQQKQQQQQQLLLGLQQQLQQKQSELQQQQQHSSKQLHLEQQQQHQIGGKQQQQHDALQQKQPLSKPKQQPNTPIKQQQQQHQPQYLLGTLQQVQPQQPIINNKQQQQQHLEQQHQHAKMKQPKKEKPELHETMQEHHNDRKHQNQKQTMHPQQQQQQQFSLQLQQHLKQQQQQRQKPMESTDSRTNVIAAPSSTAPTQHASQPNQRTHPLSKDQSSTHVHPQNSGKSKSEEVNSRKVDELHAIIEDPMSEENRNKRISVEESNQRVRKWLNANTSYFGPLEDDSEHNSHEKEVGAKDGHLRKPETMKVLDMKTEVIDQGDVNPHNAPPPLASVSHSMPRHGLVASVPHGATFVPGFMHTAPRNHLGHVRHDGTAAALASNGRSQNKHGSGSKGSFHIENLFATSSGNSQAPQQTGNVLQSTLNKDYLSYISQLSHGNQQSESSAQNRDQLLALNASKTERKSEAKFIDMSSSSAHQKEARERPITATGISGVGIPPVGISSSVIPASGMPPLRVSPSVSQFGSIGMLPQRTNMSTGSRKTPTRESPASRGSSMSPQASSVRTNLSRAEHQSPSASPQNVPKNNIIQPEAVKPGQNMTSFGMGMSRPALSIPMPMPMSNLLRPSEAAHGYHLQQQEHLAEAIRNHYVENQRLAALNSFRSPHMKASLPPFKHGHQSSKGYH